MKTLPLACAAILSASAAAADTKTYDLTGFRTISAADGVSVIVEAGGEFSIVGEAKRGNIRRLRLVVSGETLEIDRKRGWGIASWFRDDRFVVAITMPEIDGAKASSGSSMRVNVDGADGFEAAASSGASLNIKNIGGGNVDLSASSGATLSAAGTCGRIDASASSGATLAASDLQCRDADFSAGSGASMRLYATGAVDGGANSGASVQVDGKPSVWDVSVSSGASARAPGV